MHQNVVVRGIIQKDLLLLLLGKSINQENDLSIFELPGGPLAFGESAEDALTRILYDIFGYKFTTFNLRNVYSYTQNNLHIIGICYEVVATDGELLPILGQSSGYEYLWASNEDIDKSKVNEETLVALRDSINNKVVKNTDINTEVKLYTDGGSRGNPGPSALGYVVVDMNDNVVTKGSKYLGITTNNQAEYQAVKAGLRYCLENKFSRVSVYLDSQLVANQMNGIYKIKNRDLWPIHESIKQLVLQFSDGVQFTYIPREYNTDADEMVNAELDKFESNTR